MTVGDETVDLVATGVLPPTLWQVPDRLVGPWGRLLRLEPTQLLHATAMLALGALTAALATEVSPARLVRWLATLAGVTLIAKFAMAGRHPSLADVLVEVAAATAGVVAVRRHQQRTSS